MKWRWPWTSPPAPPVPPVATPPPDDPRVVYEAEKLDAGLVRLEKHVVALGNGQSMTMLLDETLQALKK